MKKADQLSEELLLTVKKQHDSHDLVNMIANIPIEQLRSELITDDQKKAFWINCYNAFFQILRKEKGVNKPQIYRNKLITIAQNQLSLDDIEHGILRRFRYKLSLGYFPNIFASSLIKSLAVSRLDWRIHFALNCGAKSCPPIAFYNSQNIEQQLELATLSFLESETEIDEQKKEISITKLFQWYHGDFGGKKGIKKIIGEQLNVDTKAYKLAYKTYSWEEQLDNYS